MLVSLKIGLQHVAPKLTANHDVPNERIWMNLIITLHRDVAGMMFCMGNPPQWSYFNNFQVSELCQFRKKWAQNSE